MNSAHTDEGNFDAEEAFGADREMQLLLQQAERPTTPDSDGVRDGLAQMAAAVIAADQKQQRRRVGLIATVVAPLLVVGTAGAAYAASNIDWSPFWNNVSERDGWAEWAQSPDATVVYTLPGGGTCELRIGEVSYDPAPNRPASVEVDPRSEDIAREFLRTADVLAAADIDGAIASMRENDSNWAQTEDGASVPFGFGTVNYDADVEYNMAVKKAVSLAVMDHVESLGVSTAGLGYQSQEDCSQ